MKKQKIDKKKLMLFGVLGILVLGLGSAAIVTYLSNSVTANISIDSPMIVGFDDGDGLPDYTTATMNLVGLYGGDIINYKSWCKNQAGVTINSYPIMTLISDNEWTGEEFTSVKFENAQYNDESEDGSLSILSMLYVVKDDGTLSLFNIGDWKTSGVTDKTILKLVFNNGILLPDGYEYISGAESWNELTATTAQGITPGDYSIKLCQLDDLLGSCL